MHSPTFLRDAAELAQRYLPPGTVSRHPPPQVSYIYFGNARGFERILMDPLYFRAITNRLEIMGHELHHYYRNRIARPHRDFGDDMLAWRIATTELEGIAGLVDKADVPGMTHAQLIAKYPDPGQFEYFEDYQDDYARSNQWLAWVESLLERADDHPDSALAIGRELAAVIPDNGRIMGAFMASTIERVLGHDRLLAVVGDPFGFWRSCNEAARRSGGSAFVLSERALRTVDRVRRAYDPGAR